MPADILRVSGLALRVLQNVMAAATSATAAGTAAASSSCSSSIDASTILDTTPNEFYSTGRVGRRNALPDILNQQHTLTSSADLPDQLSALTTRDSSDAGASTSCDAAAALAAAVAHSSDGGCKS